MKKTCKHYIEKIYPVKNSKTNEQVSMVEETLCTEPLMVDVDKTLTGFRLFDVVASKKGNVTVDDAIKCSPMYYQGQRITADDEEGVYGSVDLMKNYLKTYGLDSAIFCKNGSIIKDIPDGAMTVSEANAEAIKRIGEKYIFEEDAFFKGLACCLSYSGSDVTLTMHDAYWPLTDDIDLGDDEEAVVVRTYSIYEGEYELVSKSAILPTDKLGVSSVKTYLNLNQVMTMVEPLYQEHPFLNKVMQAVRVEVFENGANDIENKMLNAAIEMSNNNEDSAGTIVYEKK